MVSIHAPAWGATVAGYVTKKITKKFQSTHPRGVRHLPHRETCHHHRFQSTHPRGVRHAGSCAHVESSCVSIHAPAWGATFQSQPAATGGHVSIHAPAWGATAAKIRVVGTALMFQSTHPRGVRLRRIVEQYHQEMFQSTHPRGVRLPGIAGGSC